MRGARVSGRKQELIERWNGFLSHFNVYWFDESDRRLPVHSHYASPLLLVPTSDSATLNQGKITATVSWVKYPIAKEIINQKFISVAHLRNNYFVTHIVLLVIHDTMQYFKTNDMYLRRFLSVYDLDVSNPIVVPVSLRLRLWRVIQNAHSRYALNQYCKVYFVKFFTRS